MVCYLEIKELVQIDENIANYAQNLPNSAAGASAAAMGFRKSGVSSGVSWFWNSVRLRALWCSPVARNLLILLKGAVRCASVHLGTD